MLLLQVSVWPATLVAVLGAQPEETGSKLAG